MSAEDYTYTEWVHNGAEWVCQGEGESNFGKGTKGTNVFGYTSREKLEAIAFPKGTRVLYRFPRDQKFSHDPDVKVVQPEIVYKVERP